MVVVWLLVGCFIGMLSTVLATRALIVGTLRAYESDPGDPPYLGADLDKPVSAILRTKYAVFKVDPRIVRSQK